MSCVISILALYYSFYYVYSEPTLYDYLGVEKSASDEEIKGAYKFLALKYHPDRNNGDEASHDIFRKITNSYEILSNPEKRKLYDKALFNHASESEGHNVYHYSDYDFSQKKQSDEEKDKNSEIIVFNDEYDELLISYFPLKLIFLLFAFLLQL